MFAVITAGSFLLPHTWLTLILQVFTGIAVYTSLILILRDKFAWEMLALVRRHIPFLKKKS